VDEGNEKVVEINMFSLVATLATNENMLVLATFSFCVIDLVLNGLRVNSGIISLNQFSFQQCNFLFNGVNISSIMTILIPENNLIGCGQKGRRFCMTNVRKFE